MKTFLALLLLLFVPHVFAGARCIAPERPHMIISDTDKQKHLEIALQHLNEFRKNLELFKQCFEKVRIAQDDINDLEYGLNSGYIDLMVKALLDDIETHTKREIEYRELLVWYEKETLKINDAMEQFRQAKAE
jgi:hypothetical protein